MTETPITESQEPTAQPPQFSLLTLMLWVTLVGLYFGSARWVPQNFFDEHSYIVWVFVFLGFIIWYVYLTRIEPSYFCSIIFGCGFYVPILILTFSILYPQYDTDGLSLHMFLSAISFFSIAAISSILHCKKQTGSWLPFVGKRAEGESNG